MAVPYFFAAMFSVMLFDAPGSTSNPWVWLAFLAVCLYPVLLVIATVVAWVLLASGRHMSAFRVAVGGSMLAVVPVAIFLLLVAFE